MTRRPRRALRILRSLAVLVGALGPAAVPVAPLHGQLVVRRPGQAHLSAEFSDFTSRSDEVPDAGRADLRYVLELPLEGVVIHRNILAYNVVFRPEWYRVAERSDEIARHLKLDQVGRSATVQLLSRTRFPSGFGFHKTAGTATTDFGDTRYLRSSGSMFSTSWQNVALPLQLEHIRSKQDENWVSLTAGVPYRRDVDESLWRLSGRNSKTSLLLERLRSTDAVSGYAIDSRLASATNRHRWGHGSSLLTTIRYLGRENASQFVAQQEAQLRHTPAVESSASYMLSRQQALGTRSTTLMVSDQTTWSAPGWLALGAFATAYSSRYGDGWQRGVGLGPTASVSTPVAWPVSAQASAGYTVERHSLRQGGATMAVIDELHVVDSTRRIALRLPHADPSSLVLTSGDRTTQFAETIDFQFGATTPVVELYVLAGGRIAPGDTVLATYTYAASGTSGYGVSGGDLSASVTAGALSLYASRNARAYGEAAGQADAFGTFRNDAVGASYRRTMGDAVVSLFGERRHYANRLFTTSSDSWGASGTWLFSSRVQANGSWNVNESTADRGSTGMRSGAGGVTVLPLRGLRLQLEGRYWSWEQFGSRSTTQGGGAYVSYRFGLADLMFRLDQNLTTQPLVRRDTRLSTHVARSF